jgi:hypothetical protein
VETWNLKKFNHWKILKLIGDNKIYNTISFKTMFDYSVFDKQNDSELIKFRIILYKRKSLIITASKEDSLEYIYAKIHNAVYPSKDFIPQPGLTLAPKIYCIGMLKNKEDIIDVPNHRFVTLSSFMKSNPDCFKQSSFFQTSFFQSSFFQKSVYDIYVMDSEALEAMSLKREEKPSAPYHQKLFRCIRS